MKIAQVNITAGAGSTGKICSCIASILDDKGIENQIYYTHGKSNDSHAIKYASKFEIKVGAFLAKLMGNYGFNSILVTRKLICQLRSYKPDIIHLHNIHGHNCNLSMLFKYLKSTNIPVVWTFHDCWAFTGYCMYFDMAHCSKWKSECKDCPQRKRYSAIFDKSHKLWCKKKALLNGLNLTIVTPSQWLGDLVKQSFLNEFPVKVINNGIDLNVFKPTPSDFRDRYQLNHKYIVLGVAFDWGKRKGIDVFVELSRRLDERFQIVLVGTNDMIDAKLPSNIITIHRTNNQKELAAIYTAADLFVIPTREENYPTVNMEAIACGTPVLTFKTGGSPEIPDNKSGYVVDVDDIDEMERQIMKICGEALFLKSDCVSRALSFDMNKTYNAYLEIYNTLIGLVNS